MGYADDGMFLVSGIDLMDLTQLAINVVVKWGSGHCAELLLQEDPGHLVPQEEQIIGRGQSVP